MTTRARPRRPSLRLSGGAASYQANVLALSGLVALIPQTETSGSSFADLKGGTAATANSLTLANLAGPGASMGMLPYYDGVAGYTQLAASSLNSVFSASTGTMSIWANLNEAWNTANTRLLYELGADSNNYILADKLGGSTAEEILVKAGGSVNNTSGACNVTGWANFILTWDKLGNQIIAYKNNSVTASVAYAGTWSGSLANGFSFLGRWQGGLYWYGWLGWFSLFNKVVSASDRAVLSTAA